MTTSPAHGTAWRVETPRPADRGLVVRLLEQVVAADASVAPEVASGAQRPGPWLQRVRPAWSGVVVDPSSASRTVLGYAAVTPVAGGHAVRDVLVAPGAPDGVEQALRAAAAEAVTALAAASPVAPEEVELETAAVTYPAERATRRRGRAALVGAAAIAALGTAGVLAVQVGVSPFGGSLPFLSPDPVGRDAGATGAPAPGASPQATPQPVLAAGQPIQPLPQPPSDGGPTGSAGPTATPSPGGGPTGTPTDPPQPPPGPTSSLLDPVVTTVVATVDGLTGGALSPVTGTVEGTTDGLTDTLDDLLPPLGR